MGLWKSDYTILECRSFAHDHKIVENKSFRLKWYRELII